MCMVKQDVFLVLSYVAKCVRISIGGTSVLVGVVGDVQYWALELVRVVLGFFSLLSDRTRKCLRR